MIIRYSAAVFTPAGWRPEVITARAEKISDKRCRVVEVLDVGDNGSAGYASRTGAKRQVYCVGGVARRQVGKVKLTGSLLATLGEEGSSCD
jgi:hypothetical protein